MGKKEKASKWQVTRKTEVQNLDGDYLKISMKLDLGGNIWIIALHDHGVLELVKIKVTGSETFEWLGTKLAKGPEKRCLAQKTFAAACFKGEDKDKDKYKVHLKASKEDDKEEDEKDEEDEEEDEEDEDEEKEEKEDEVGKDDKEKDK